MRGSPSCLLLPLGPILVVPFQSLVFPLALPSTDTNEYEAAAVGNPRISKSWTQSGIHVASDLWSDCFHDLFLTALAAVHTVHTD